MILKRKRIFVPYFALYLKFMYASIYVESIIISRGEIAKSKKYFGLELLLLVILLRQFILMRQKVFIAIIISIQIIRKCTE